MRLRYVKGARQLIEHHPEYIYDDDKNHKRLKLDTLFAKKQPLHVEIGMGKGQFIYTLASMNPGINYIGIEKFDSAIVKALYKVLEQPLPNLKLLRMDATYLEELFPSQSIDRIYLTFSDPWPKARHEKRRLTNPRFLQQYERLLQSNGDVYFKTDNTDLFDYSVDVMTEYGMEILSITRDLHKESTEPIVTTEFEDKFREQGVPIKRLIARFKEEDNG